MSKLLIHYELEGHGIPFVFIHGLGADLQQSKELIAPVDGTWKILVDCPAHGKSSLVDSSLLSFNFMSDEILKVVDDLNIPEFVVGGISMGAGIAMNMMDRFKHRLIGAILVRPAWLNNPHPFNLTLMDLSRSLRDSPDPEKTFRSSPAFKALENTIPNAAKSLLNQFDRPQGLSATIDLLHKMISDAPLENLDKLKYFRKPVCILTNQKDPMHPAEFGLSIKEILPMALLHDVYPKYLGAQRHNSECQTIIQDFIDMHFLNHQQ